MNAVIRVFGLLLLALGITFLVWGMNERDTFANRFLKQMADKYPEETKNYIFGGITMIVVGTGILYVSFCKRKR
jgi:uncharacterized protein YjeT (DUF2065 family)